LKVTGGTYVCLRGRFVSSILILFLLIPLLSLADSAPAGKCENTFPNLVSDICWKCFFPIRIGGRIVMKAADIPDNVDTQNVDDFNPSEYTCFCDDERGVPTAGIYVSFWEPARVIEVIMRPGCFSFLFGMDLGKNMDLFGAYGERGWYMTPDDKVYYNVHTYAVPLLEIMELIKDMDWCKDWFQDLDIMYFTEVDPLWNDEELYVYMYPEVGVFANPLAQALCAADCVSASASYPLNAMFWCAGCWGSMYPPLGSTGATGSPPRTTSLIASRLMFKLSRLPVPPAMELDTSGPQAKCGQTDRMIRPILKKSQYRFSMLRPIPETKTCHTLGSSSFLWGEWRNIPGKEVYTYMVWRKRNCCLRILP
jgi:conjugal transfer pilus assembly protein TraU